METITAHPTGAALGAEIRGVDLSQPLDSATVARLNALWLEHEVIYFHNQTLSPAQHIGFSEHFGDVEVHVRTDCCRVDYPKIFVVSNIIENGKPIGAGDAGTRWHFDGCCTEKPSRGSLLYAKIVPMQNGVTLGDTMFSSMTKAYQALPDEMKQRLQGMKAVNSYVKGYYRPIRATKRPELTPEQMKKVPELEVPIVRRHPVTGKSCLYVNDTFTARIAGVSEAESNALLDYLFKHVSRPEFIYRHNWRVGDLLAWDNCSTQHCAIADYPPRHRLMERTTIMGAASVRDAMAAVAA
jgi:taurine dioxygenase